MSGYFVYGSNVDVNIIKSISAGPLAPQRVEFSAQNDDAHDDTVDIVNDETPLLKNRQMIASDEDKKAENHLLASSSKQNVQAKSDPQPSSELILIPLWQKVLNIEIICIGIIGGLAATVSAIIAIATPDSLSVPCYVSLNGAGS
ncbi:Hypothetical predicted protein [Mytilus galloprovincialis]|nr:Hypothetical predicted protein [Mytilus galloprovincialis]